MLKNGCPQVRISLAFLCSLQLNGVEPPVKLSLGMARSTNRARANSQHEIPWGPQKQLPWIAVDLVLELGSRWVLLWVELDTGETWAFLFFFFLYKLSYPQTQLVCEYDSQPGIFHSCASLLSGMQILLARLMSSDSCAALPSSSWVSDTCAIHLKALGCTGVIGLIGGLSGFTAVTGDWGGQILSSLLAVGMHAMAISLAVETSLESAG